MSLRRFAPRALLATALAGLGSTNSALPAADLSNQLKSDVQLHAMNDELVRSKTLQLNNLDKPYFIQYAVGDNQQFAISASLGGIINSSSIHLRQPVLQVRVGDYTFDNTNSVYSQSARFGLFPIDDDYRTMRGNLWLWTDALYKGSADQITRKRAILREIADPDKTPDFAHAPAVQLLQPLPPDPGFQETQWQNALRKASAVFSNFQSITASNIRLRVISSTYRLINSEGTVVRTPQQLSDITIVSSALAGDGSRVWNHAFLTALLPSQLPGADALTAVAGRTATETRNLAEAPAAEDYAGPVLFAGEAAAEMVAQTLTDTLRLPRKPLSPPGANDPEARVIDSVWAGRIGSKVLPDWLSLVDDPLQQRAGDQILVGHYDVDDEGVLAQRVSLVEKGVLKAFLLSREPVRTFDASNGHGRLPGGYGNASPVIGNLFVQATGGVSEDQLKAQLLEKVKSAGLKFGLIIRKIDFPSTSNLQELEALARQLQKSGFARTLNAPILVYKAYPDGHEELVRGLRFREFSAKDLRDIAAAGNHPFVLNYVNNGSSFNLAGFGSDATTSSVICPSLLFDNVELAKAENEAGRPPLVPSPVLAAAQ